MRGDNHLLAVTVTTDEVTNEVKPLFALPVQVCSAFDTTTDVRFDVAAPSGVKREQVWRDPTTGELVEDADCPRGVFVGDQFREIPAGARDEVAERTKLKTMVALGEMPLDEAWTLYGGRVKHRYFLQVPAKGGSAKAYRLVYEALKGGKGKPALAIVTKRTAKSRQKLCFIYPDPLAEALVMVETAFAAEVKEADDQVRAHLAATVDEAAIAKARMVIESLGDGHLAMENEVDEAVGMKRDLIEAAVEGVEYTAPRKVAEVVEEDDLMGALEASLAAAA